MPHRSGSADLPLHYGRVPHWLAERMTRLGAVIAEAIVIEYGRDEFLRRLAHPFWFQAFGAVMGMDWHSSGITTSVIGALKRGLEPLSGELGLHVCGGRGAHSRKTPHELAAIGEKVGFDGATLARASRLVAKVDSAAVQDGFDLYLDGFIVADDGAWVVVQQGMNGDTRQARRYHWLSEGLKSFVEEPHAAIEGEAQGVIVNLTDRRAEASRRGQLDLLSDLGPDGVVREFAKLAASAAAPVAAIDHRGRRGQRPRLLAASAAAPVAAIDDRGRRGQRPRLLPASVAAPVAAIDDRGRRGQRPRLQTLSDSSYGPGEAQLVLPHHVMPARHDVRSEDILVRRLHGNLAAAAEQGPKDFAELLLTPGVGARTVRALAQVAEVVHGAPYRFGDPARFSLAHGGKDRHPYPVPLKVYDRTIEVLKAAVKKAKLGRSDELAAIRRLDAEARRLEAYASGPSPEALMAEERARSHEYGGRSVFGREPAPGAVIVRSEAGNQSSGT
jgi:hypothetical protein